MNLRLIFTFLNFPLIFALNFEGCDKVENITVGKPFVFESANYSVTNLSKKYQPGSSCRVQCIAPEGYTIHVNGTINLDRKPGIFNCPGQTQQFLYSREGLNAFHHSELACTTSTININSLLNEITLGYVSELDEGRAGRFRVTVSAQLITSQTCECGWGLHSSNGNTNGKSFQGYTSVVAFLDEEKDEVTCSGSIISSKYIISAAHCFPDAAAALKLKVLAGYRGYPANEDPYQATYEIEKLTVHEDYATKPEKSDVAIVQTKTAIKFNRGVSPICMPLARSFTLEEFYSRSRTFDLVAWQKYKGDGSEQIIVNEEKTSFPMRECQNFYKIIYGSKSHLCTSLNATSTVNGEQNGAQLIFTSGDRKYLLGIFDPSIKPLNGYPMVYLRVSNILPWIIKNTNQVMMCSRYF